MRHCTNPTHWFHRAQKNGSRKTLRHTGNVQAIVITINKVHVGMTRGPEEDKVARGAPNVSVGGRIFFAKVGFIFNDAASEKHPSFTADKQLAQQLAPHNNWISIEECP